MQYYYFGSIASQQVIYSRHYAHKLAIITNSCICDSFYSSLMTNVFGENAYVWWQSLLHIKCSTHSCSQYINKKHWYAQYLFDDYDTLVSNIEDSSACYMSILISIKCCLRCRVWWGHTVKMQALTSTDIYLAELQHYLYYCEQWDFESWHWTNHKDCRTF